MRSPHCHRAILTALAVILARSTPTAQQLPPVAPKHAAPSAANFTSFIRSVPIGSERVAVARSGDGWTISGSGRLGAPIDIGAQRLEIRYDPNWTPLELALDATVGGK